ncbi:MAG: type II toxin-antitoxin system VapC family toxin [Magnetococcales bacterium]|nr:type II toxin-antitoxin system VapC family toxin [Magnetococcales bacterium]
MNCLFDTNPLIYHLNAILPVDGERLIARGLQTGGCYSVITRIEILGYPMSLEQLRMARRLLGGFAEVGLTPLIVERTIQLRLECRRLKIPDAIIAATALEHALPLVTRNLADFESVQGLSLIDPFAAWH